MNSVKEKQYSSKKFYITNVSIEYSSIKACLTLL
jgi:hypothetical protein